MEPLAYSETFSAERLLGNILAAEFGWAVQNSVSLSELQEIAAEHNIVAVLLDLETLGISGNQALQAVREVAPKALPIVCHTSSHPIHWPELAEAGAFNALLLPFHAGEVRQSMAFVWEAQQRRRAKLVSLPRRASEHRRAQEVRALADA